jgi:signal transduction histidine kinase
VREVDARLRLVVIAAVVFGLAAEAARYAWSDVVHWIPDLVTGWGIVACGLIAARRRPESAVGAILAGSGFAWFIGNFAATPVPWIGAIALQLLLVHRALIAHAILAVPSGRTTSAASKATVLAGYVLWCLPPIATSVPGGVLLGAAPVLAAGRDLAGAHPHERRVRTVAVAGAVVLGVAYAVAVLSHDVVPSGRANLALLLLTEASVLVSGILALYAVLLPRLEGDRLADAVGDLRELRTDDVRDALAAALDDPSIEIGYWHPSTSTYLNAAGEPVELHAGDRRVAMDVAIEDGPAAIVLHDPALLGQPAAAESVKASVQLSAANARLRAGLRDQLADVRASRRRLLRAGDAARDALERRLEQGTLRRAAAIADALGRLETGGTAPAAERAGVVLKSAVGDLRAIARGLHPRVVDTGGLAAALASLGAAGDASVEVQVSAGDMPSDVALAAYFVCAEGLANAVKHARATQIRITVREVAGALEVNVIDDGIGGADAKRGSGLVGIADRVAAMGGWLALASEPGSGTVLQASLPLGGPASG